jgi:hypothetical protein
MFIEGRAGVSALRQSRQDDPCYSLRAALAERLAFHGSLARGADLTLPRASIWRQAASAPLQGCLAAEKMPASLSSG